MKKIARLTGIGYLLIFVTGFYGNFFVLENLYVKNDATSTLNNILNNPDLYLTGVFAFLIMVLADLVLAWPLYKLLQATHKKMALTSSILRVINAGFFFVALSYLFNICPASHHEGVGLSAELTMHSLEQFNRVWTAGLLVFGVHLLMLGGLIFASTSFPKILGVLIVIAGMGYLVDCSAQLWWHNYHDYRDLFELIVVIPGVLGEFSLTLWLLIKGVKDEPLQTEDDILVH